MLRSRRALATAVFLLLVLVASTAVYLINSSVDQREVVVRGVDGQVIGNNQVALGFYYPDESNGLIFFRQGESFYVFLYVTGFGFVQSVNVTTNGFEGSVVAPFLPMSVDNATQPSVVILEITTMRCCFNGTVDFTLNAT